MKITCHSCAAKYTVSDEKVQGKTVKMKCRKCGATIVVGGAASAGEGAGDDAGVDLPAGSYLVNVTDGDQRTMQLAEIVEAYNQGVVTGDTYVWADGMSDWQALSENDAIVAALNAAAGAPAAEAPAAAAYGGTNGTNGNHAYDAPYAAPAATSPAYGSGGDVFGGSPAYAASESNRPAAARKDAGRKSGDLFGGGGGGYDAPGLAPAASSSGTGKRDENSVLFSLSALTATSGPPSRPVGGATTATKEDSGLIDLKALAASAAPAPAEAQAAPAIDAVGLFPLGAPIAAPTPAPMAMGPASLAPAQPQKRSPLPLVLGGLVAVAAIVGVFFVVRGSAEQTPTATAAANTPPPPTATATETAAATAEPSASALADAADSASAEPSASASAAPVAVAKGGGYKGGGAKPAGTAKGGSTAAAPAGTSKPPSGGAKGPCSHCGSDLHCAMKCSAGKK